MSTTTQNSNISAQVYVLFTTFVIRKTQTFLHRFTSNITSFLHACTDVFCLLWCCAPFAQLSRAKNKQMKLKFQSLYPILYYAKIQTFLYRFTANITSCLQLCRVVFFLFCRDVRQTCAHFAQLSRANNAHNFNEISKGLTTFVLRKTETYLHRFTANITSCLQACRVVFCLLCTLCTTF